VRAASQKFMRIFVRLSLEAEGIETMIGPVVVRREDTIGAAEAKIGVRPCRHTVVPLQLVVAAADVVCIPVLCVPYSPCVHVALLLPCITAPRAAMAD
jgi:hypothetical protein